MEPKTTRLNRNYTKSAEYYYKWEIDVMAKPEFIYNIDAMMNLVEVPKSMLRNPKF